MSNQWLTNVNDIQLTLKMLESEDSAKRYFAAEILGDIGRSKNGLLRKTVVRTLAKLSSDDESAFVRLVAERSRREINGDFDETWEKYKPQEPRGTLREQYYLKKG